MPNPTQVLVDGRTRIIPNPIHVLVNRGTRLMLNPTQVYIDGGTRPLFMSNPAMFVFVSGVKTPSSPREKRDKHNLCGAFYIC